MFFNAFATDNFRERRASQIGAGVSYDPESLLTGEELAAGMTYANSRRDWRNEADYRDAIAGKFETETILAIAPRVRLTETSFINCNIEATSPIAQGLEMDSAILAGKLSASSADENWHLGNGTLAYPLSM